jgi:hypothetical protein
MNVRNHIELYVGPESGGTTERELQLRSGGSDDASGSSVWPYFSSEIARLSGSAVTEHGALRAAVATDIGRQRRQR